jgi:hypothetical protein
MSTSTLSRTRNLQWIPNQQVKVKLLEFSQTDTIGELLLNSIGVTSRRNLLHHG